MSKDNRKNRTSRLKKYLPDEGMLIDKTRGDSENITVHSWKNNPVELWVWDIGPAGPTRIELHKLEDYPTLDNINQALALYMVWREEHRRTKGLLAGPGSEKDRVLSECYKDWMDSGYKETVLRALEPKYVSSRSDPHNPSATDSYYRQMRRLKAKDVKN